MLLGGGDLRDQMVPEIVPGVELVVAQGDRHAEDAPLPGRLEDQFAVLARHGQVVAEILDAPIGIVRSARPSRQPRRWRAGGLAR